MNESINLNLSKQIRKKQLELSINNELDKIFGNNKYRLYYDLETGKQITPTRKETKIKFDIEIVDKLKNNIEKILKNLNYTLIDIDKNIAKNDKTKQLIKITKVLTDTDYSIVKQYNEYLGSLTKKYNGDNKLCVVISRHSHDIASMSSKPNISSCEDLRYYTDIKQTAIDNDDIGEGYGVTVWTAIIDGSLIFYLIKEGDWNINDPISRVIGNTACEFGNSHHFYGSFNNKFKNFVSEWMSYYEKKIHNKNNIRTDENFYNKTSEEIIDVIQTLRNSEYDNVIKGLITNNRYDVIYNMLFKSDDKNKEFKVFDEEKVPYLLNDLYRLFGYKIFNILPENIKTPIFNNINNSLKNKLYNVKTLYDILYDDFDNTHLVKIVKKNPEFKNYFKKYDFININSQDNDHNYKSIPYENVSKIVNNDIYNKIKQYINMINKIPDIKGKIKDYYDRVFSL